MRPVTRSAPLILKRESRGRGVAYWATADQGRDTGQVSHSLGLGLSPVEEQGQPWSRGPRPAARRGGRRSGSVALALALSLPGQDLRRRHSWVPVSCLGPYVPSARNGAGFDHLRKTSGNYVIKPVDFVAVPAREQIFAHENFIVFWN